MEQIIRKILQKHSFTEEVQDRIIYDIFEEFLKETIRRTFSQARKWEDMENMEIESMIYDTENDEWVLVIKQKHKKYDCTFSFITNNVWIGGSDPCFSYDREFNIDWY